MQKFIFKIIEENRNNFTVEEYKLIINHIELTKKIYLLGYMNSRETYK